ncbi:MAG: DUF481 domain-containing protein, partial [Phycisphaeraceae bacterium]|nr:DUF481 domain-containing protein [Phycisphaeraceae bacterium]
GSRLHGEITRWVEDEVVIETGFAGKITVDPAQVRGITTETPRAVNLSTGDRVVGRLVWSAEEGQRLVETTFGDVQLDDVSLTAVHAVGEAEATGKGEVSTEAANEVVREEADRRVAEARETYEKKVEELKAEQAKWRNPWSATLQIGGSGTSGNKDTMNVRGRFEARREMPDDRLTLYLRGQYAESEGDKTANELIGGANLEVDISERWFTWGTLQLEHDEFEQLDLRATGTAGLGRFWIERPDQVLKTHAGLGFEHESFEDGESNTEPVAELGLAYKQKVNDWLDFSHEATYEPVLGDPLNEYRLEFETAGEIPIAGDKPWKLRLGVTNEYDSMPQPGVDRLDTTYFLDLVLEFDGE